jgi:delta24(24(1))-sterol reductase
LALPGIVVKGLPIKSEGGRQLEYLCNGVAAWYATILLVVALHLGGLWKITYIIDNFGSLMSVAIICANLISFLIYGSAFLLKKTVRMTHNHLYDFFMGAYLNPRLGKLDLKMWAEIRVSWILLFLITLSCAVKQYETQGEVSISLIFLLLAHFLYANAC